MVKNTLVFNGTVRLLCKKINDILVCFFVKDLHSQMDSIYAKKNKGEYPKIQSRIVIFILNNSGRSSCKMQRARHLNKYAIRYLQHVIEYVHILHHHKSYCSLSALYYSLTNNSFDIFLGDSIFLDAQSLLTNRANIYNASLPNIIFNSCEVILDVNFGQDALLQIAINVTPNNALTLCK